MLNLKKKERGNDGIKQGTIHFKFVWKQTVMNTKATGVNIVISATNTGVWFDHMDKNGLRFYCNISTPVVRCRDGPATMDGNI